MADTVTVRIWKQLRDKFKSAQTKRSKSDIVNAALDMYLNGDPLTNDIVASLTRIGVTLDEIRELEKQRLKEQSNDESRTQS